MLHEAIVVDAHNDSIVAHIRRGGLAFDRLERADHATDEEGMEGVIRLLRDPIPASSPVQLNVPKMRAGGIDAGFFAVDVTRARNNHLSYALEAYGFFDAEASRTGEFVVATTVQEIREAKAAGKLAAVLVMENSDGLEGSLYVLRMLHRLGVRVIGLTHNPRSRAADGVGETETGGGLTRFGRALVREMNELGMLIDVSHLSARGFSEVLQLSAEPVIASHTCCRALCDHPRNLTDDQLRALAEAGGVAGITCVPDFVDSEKPNFDRMMDHVEHAIDVAGIGGVGIGSDFDGGGTVVTDASEYGRIAAGLRERGFTDRDVAQVMGGNVLRVFSAVCG